MIKTKDIIKYINNPILTFYSDFKNAYDGYSQIYIAVNDLNPYYGFKRIDKVENYIDFYFVNSDYLNLQDQKNINYFKSINFIKINKNQFNKNKMENIFWNNSLNYYYFSYMTKNNSIRSVLKFIFNKITEV